MELWENYKQSWADLVRVAKKIIEEYGLESLKEFCEDTDIPYHTLENYRWVDSSTSELDELQRLELGPNKLQLIAPLDPETQKQVAKVAVEEKQTVEQVKAQVLKATGKSGETKLDLVKYTEKLAKTSSEVTELPVAVIVKVYVELDKASAWLPSEMNTICLSTINNFSEMSHFGHTMAYRFSKDHSLCVT